MDPARLHAIMSGRDRSLGARLARLGLSCLAPFYRLGVGARNRMFDLGIRKPRKLPRPVISVGNITTGGTGKTPMVIEIAQRLVAAGKRPVVLLRGFAAQSSIRGEIPPRPQRLPAGMTSWEGIDELAVLRDQLPRAVDAIADPWRWRAGKAAIEGKPEIDCVILDDAFQHRQLHRDLDLVLIDASNPFGFGRMLPRGLVREPLSNLRRANAVIVTRAEQAAAGDLQILDQSIEELTGKRPLAHVAFRWRGLLDRHDAEFHLGHLGDRKVRGICGIGNPGAFAATLKSHAAASDVVSLRDHFEYTADSLRDLFRQARSDGRDCIVTTEKDWVKWKRLLDGIDDPPAIYRACLHTAFLDGSEALDAALRDVVHG